MYIYVRPKNYILSEVIPSIELPWVFDQLLKWEQTGARARQACDKYECTYVDRKQELIAVYHLIQ